MASSFKDRLVYEIKDWILWISASIIIATVVGSMASVVLDTGTPFMAVMSGSMLHDESTANNYILWMQNRGFSIDEINSFQLREGFAKGDVVIVAGQSKYNVGDVVIYRIPEQSMPIVHRIISVSGTSYETKGDHNPIADPWRAEYDKIEGKVILVIPYVGFIKVLPMEALTWVLGK